MKKYGVDEAACARMLGKFSELVRRQHALMQQSLQGVASPMPIIDLAALTESAAAVGAENLFKALKSSAHSSMDSKAARNILEELKSLAEALPGE